MTPLIDTYGRVHRDLRVSVTDRCNLRCTYCMPPDFADWLPGDHLLSIDELLTVIGIAVDEGIRTIRLTGASRCCARTSSRSSGVSTPCPIRRESR